MSDRYQIIKKIGQGGIGAVYEAFDTQLKRQVALKRVLTPDQAKPEAVAAAAESLMQEATTMSTLNHPNIVSVYDVGRDEQGGFVVMELLRGETLDQTISESLLTLEDFREIVGQTLEALIAAQAADMLHRDLKPGNIMVIWRPSGKFQVKILDFGLAKVSQGPSKQTIDQGDAILGSIFFMAPEQFERAPLTFATDLYAMGAIYYFTLTGKYPFNGPSAAAVMASHLRHDVASLEELRPDLPPEISQWVMWLINRNPEDRPQSARDALDVFPPAQTTGEVVMMAAMVADDVPVARVIAASQAPTPAPKRKVPAPPPAASPSKSVSISKATGPVSATARQQTQSYAIRPDDEEEDGDQKKKIILIAAASVGALVILTAVGLHLQKEFALAGFRNRINALAVANPQGTPKDVHLLAEFLSTDPKRSDPRALEILSAIQGPGVDEAIVSELKGAAQGPIRTGLMKAIGKRSSTPAFDTVLAIYRSSTGEERAVAGATLQYIAKPGQEATLLAFLKDNIPNRTDLEHAVVNLLRQNSDVAKRSAPVLSELAISTGDYRKSLFRIAGRIGGDEAVKTFTRLVGDKANDEGFLVDLVMGLSLWPDRGAAGLARQLMSNENLDVASDSSRAYIRMLSIPGEGDDTGNWKFVLEKASRGDALNIFEAMADQPTTSTLNFLKAASFPGWERTFQQAQKSVEEAAAAAIPVVSGKVIGAQLAKPRGEPEGATYVEDGSYWMWTSPSSWFIWVLNFPKPGTYKVEVIGAAELGGDSQFTLTLAGQKITGKSVSTETKTAFVPVKIDGAGTVQLKPEQVGIQVLALRGGSITKPKIMNLSGVRLTAK